MAKRLKKQLQDLSRAWVAEGLPPREQVMQKAAEIEAWKEKNQIQTVWESPPRMVTATLDDGLGSGLLLIERYARIMGVMVDPMGLLQKPDVIVSYCQIEPPELLGLTVLQLDSDDDLARIGGHLPPKTRLIAGGAAFRLDPGLAERCKVDHVAGGVADFINYLLAWSPVD